MGNQQTKPTDETQQSTQKEKTDDEQSVPGDDKNVKLKAEEWSDLREKSRWCTDVFFLILIVGVWVGTTVFGLVALGFIESDSLDSGNPGRLTNVVDYQGNICGIDDGFKDLRYGYYLPDSSAVCIENCPLSSKFDKFYCRYNLQEEADESVLVGYEYVLQERCMYVVKTREFLNRCLPDVDVEEAAEDAADEFADAYKASNSSSSADDDVLKSIERIRYDDENSGGGWFNSFIADLRHLYGYIIGFGVVVSAMIGFFYLWLLQIPGLLFTLIWETIVSVGLLLAMSAYFLWAQANTWEENGLHSDPEIFTMRFFSYALMAATVLYIVLIIALRKRIQLAIGIIKQAAQALSSEPALLSLPVAQALGLLMFLVPWIVYSVYLASSGEVTVKEVDLTPIDFGDDDGDDNVDDGTYRYRTFEYKDNTRYAFLFMVFSCLWTTEFILSLGQIIIALSIAAWYFTRDKKSVGTLTVLWAYRTAVVYHAGTAAHGALVIAIIRIIRYILSYIQKRVNRSESKVAKYIICCCRCFFFCLEKVFKYLSRNAYILTAIYGYGFCTAARKAFFLLLRNILRVAAVNLISSFLLFIGKIFIPVAATCLCYLTISYNVEPDDVSGIVAPLIFTFLISYWIAAMFLDIFSMGIDTILLCFIADEEMFEPAKRFATGALMSTLQVTAMKAEKAKISKQDLSSDEDISVDRRDDSNSCCTCCCCYCSDCCGNNTSDPVVPAPVVAVDAEESNSKKRFKRRSDAYKASEDNEK